MRRALGAAGKGKRDRAHLAEELERRVMLSSAVAAFAPQVTLGVGSQPRGVVTADVNNDGKLDLVVTNGAGNNVGVLLGNGNGSFGAEVTFATGTTPFGVAVGDVNRDGKLDLVVANNGSGNVSVLLGNGNGTFGSQTQLGAGAQARWVAVGDVNGDGRPDLLVTSYGAGTVSVMLGNGNGSFGGQATFSAGSQASSISVADFNRDGKLDVAVGNKTPGTVSVLLGNGNGTFGARSTYSAGALPFSVASGDVNGDGKLDLVVAEEGTGVGVMLGNGNGTFGNQTTFGAGTTACAVVVGDFNVDGKLDVAVANYGSNSVSVLQGNGNGSFAGQKTFGTGASPFSIASGDVNRDGRVDLVVGNFGVGSSVGLLAGDVQPYVVSINRSVPSTQSTSATSVTFSVTFSQAVSGVGATDFALALNAVTATTPVVVSGSGANYTVTVNGVSGNGTLGLNLVDDGSIRDGLGNPLGPGGAVGLMPQQTYAAVSAPDCVTAADVNGDGITDLVVGDTGTSIGVQVLLGNGDGTFKPQQLAGAASDPYEIIVNDVNGDGKPDLVVTNLRNYPEVLLGNGNGTFQAPLTFGISSAEGAAVGDINGDGRADVVFTDVSANHLGIALGNGNGTFGAAQTLAIAGTFPIFLSVADMNGDGRADVVVAGGVEELLGNGDGTFQALRTFSAGGQTIHLGIADVNGDGKADFVGTLNGLPQLSVLLGNGDGTFQPYQTPGIGTFAESISAADLNGDGRLDLIVTHRGNNTAGVVFGNGDGTFGPEQTYAVGADPRRLAVADFNGDGRPDVATANFYGNDVSVLLSGSNGSFTGQTYTVVPPPPSTYVVQRLALEGTNATGASPQSGLTRDTAGNFYGTTQNGGAYGDGTIFEIAAGSSTITTLASFNGAGGANPFMGVAVDGSGNLFGTTPEGGANNAGTVWELPHNSSTINVLKSFNFGENQTNGSYGPGTLTVDAAGNVYGVAVGLYLNGSVFEIAHDTLAVSTLATFSTSGGGLGGPSGTVVVDGSGNVFGVAQAGGAANDGGVFEIVQGSGVVTTVASFNGTNGRQPSGGLVRDGSGNLFGTTRYGGPSDEGTLFEIASGTGVITTLGSFNGTNGQEPLGAPVLDASGNLWGTTSSVFGMSGDSFRYGSIYKWTKAGASLTTPQGFDQNSGAQPFGALVLDSSGNLWGTTTAGGGPGNQGVVFKYSPTFGLSDVAVFDPVGAYNAGGMTVDSAGNLYGVLQYGGALDNGAVFKIPKGTTNMITIASFNGSNGDYPSSIIVDGSGNIFGTAVTGGTSNYGTVWEIAAGTSNITVLGSFNFYNGCYPQDMIMDGGGNLWILSSQGGTTQYGALSELPKGSTSVGLVASFGQGNAFPEAGFIRDAAGNFYGVTQGLGGGTGVSTLWEVAAGSGTVTTMASFPVNETIYGVVMDGAGNLYAERFGGSQGDYGSIMMLPHGGTTIQTVANFNANTGALPEGKMVIDAAGNIFGFTDSGGRLNGGTLYELPQGSGVITTLAYFNGVQAEHPQWGLVVDGSGNFYGMGLGGGGGPYPDLGGNGAPGAGTVFEMAKVAVGETIQGTAGTDTITLREDADMQHVDWTMGASSGVVPNSDRNGLVLIGGGGSDVINLDYGNGDPLPQALHFSGTFTVNGFQGDNPLAGTNFEIGRSTVYLSYGSPAADLVMKNSVRTALIWGYSAGEWNGYPSASFGTITSFAAANSGRTTGVGWADWSDGIGDTVPNTVELKYSLNGDTNLDGKVDIFDLNNLLPHFNGTGDWIGGDFNYNGQVDVFDLNALLPNFNATLTNQATPAVEAAAVVAGAVNSSSTTSVVTAEAVNGAVAGLNSSDEENVTNAKDRQKRHGRR